MSIRSYRDLIVWQKAMELVVQCYRMTRQFPESERFGLTSQLQRAAVSIPANIAEGRERGHRKEFIRHLGIARGSQAELETHFEIAIRLGYFNPDQHPGVKNQIDEVGRMLTALRASLIRNEKKR